MGSYSVDAEKNGTTLTKQAGLLGCLLLIAAVVVLPNLGIFSPDDIMIRAAPDPSWNLLVRSAADGRFCFTGIVVLLHFIGAKSVDILALGIVSLIVGLPVLYCALLNFSGVCVKKYEAIFGFVAFVLSGYMFDVYQFSYTSLEVGGVFLLTAGILRLSMKEGSRWLVMAVVSLLGWLALGFYQTYPYLILMCLIASCVLRCFEGSVSKEEARAILKKSVWLLFTVAISIVLYFITNKLLKELGVVAYQYYPARAFSLSFLPNNIFHYGISIIQLMIFEVLNYGYMYSFLFQLAILVSAVWLVRVCAVSSKRHDGRNMRLFFIALIVLIICIPDPTVLLLETYRPSQRSVSPLCLVYAFLLLGAVRSFNGRKSICIIAALCIGTQAVVYASELSGRSDQQTFDFIFAQHIIAQARQTLPNGQHVVVHAHFVPEQNLIQIPRSFDYGEGLFTTREAAAALVSYLSNGQVSLVYDDVK